MTEQEKFTVSVSSAKTYHACNTQWHLGSVEKIRQPPTPATEIGTKFAELTEALSNNEKDISKWVNPDNPTITSLYEKNKDFLEMLRVEGGKPEFEFAFGINLYIAYVGYSDRILETADRIIIRDYKTAGSWQYTLTDKTLGADEQMNIYGYFYHTYYNKQNKPIWLEHQQFHKGTGMRRPVQVPYNHEEGKAIYDWLVETAEAMVLEKRKKIEDVNKNFKSCDKFGGCPYIGYCKNGLSLEELREMLNPNVKNRTKEELVEMKPEARLAELKAEQDFNKTGNKILTTIKKGNDMDIKERLRLIKEKQEANKKAGAFVEPVKTEIAKAVEVVEGKIESKKEGLVEGSLFVTPTIEKQIIENVIAGADAIIKRNETGLPSSVNTQIVTPNPLNTKVRTRRTKAEMAQVIEEQGKTPVISKDLADTVAQNLENVEVKTDPPAYANKENPDFINCGSTIFKKQVLVLVGCAFLEEDKNNPSDFLHEKYIAPILKQENIPHISCSEFSKANKSVMLFAQSILDDIYKGYESINIDIRRPVDALVYTMIMDLDTRKNGKRFRLIRSTF